MEQSSQATRPHSALHRVIGITMLAVLGYLVVAVWGGFSKFGATMSEFRWSLFVLALGLAALNYVLRFGKWVYYLRVLDIRGIPLVDNFLIYLSGFVLTITPGKVGEAYKSVVLEERFGTPVALTAPLVLSERLADVIAIVLLIAIGSIGFSGGLGWAIAGASAVLIVLAIVSNARLCMHIMGRLESRGGKLGALMPKVRIAYDSLRITLSPKHLLVPTLLSLAAWAAECTALGVVARGFGVDISLTKCLFYYATSILAGALIPIPGGLGVTEGILFKHLLGNMTDTVARAAMMLTRVATLWFAVALGFCALGLLKLRPRAAESSAARR